MPYNQVRVTSTRNFAKVSLRHKNHSFSAPENASLGQKSLSLQRGRHFGKKVSLCRKSATSTRKRLYVNQVKNFWRLSRSGSCAEVMRISYYPKGCIKGGIFPTQTSLWGRWSPESERTTLLGITQMVAILGNVFGNELTALICDKLGWKWAFYLFGIFGIVISLVWVFYFRNSPEEMPS